VASREAQYNNQISAWLSVGKSGVEQLLRRCNASKVEHCSSELRKILRAAGKVSLQLWAQDTKIEIFQELEEETSICHRFNGEYARGNPLMRAYTDDDNLTYSKVDMVVRPGVKMFRLDRKEGQRKALIVAKACAWLSVGKSNPSTPQATKQAALPTNTLFDDILIISYHHLHTMSRRAQNSSEFSVTGSIKSLARTTIEYTGFPASLDEEFLRDKSAHDTLSHQLSTRSGVSTTSTLAREYTTANENPYDTKLTEIGSGQCGTVFAVVGSEEVSQLCLMHTLFVDFHTDPSTS